MAIDQQETYSWYAFRLPSRTPREAQKLAHRNGYETYYAMRRSLKDDSYDAVTDDSKLYRHSALMPTILFVKCPRQYALQMREHQVMWPISMPGQREPSPIGEKQMQLFRTAVESGCRNLEVIDPALAVGTKVRVLDGIFKGQEGHIVKIRGDKRFVISIPGVAAIATIYIPKHLLTKAEGN